MRAISLLNIVPIAAGLGGCTKGAGLQNPRQAPKSMADNPAAQADDFPPFVRIRSLSWAGSGCPAGTVTSDLTPGFTLSFGSFVAEIGPGVPPSQSRENCQILVDLDFSQGWSYSLADVDCHGSANLGPGVSGVQESAYYFQGEFQTGRLQTPLKGPKVGDYQIHASLPLDALVWSPCGAQRALNINSSVWVENKSGNPNARGAMTIAKCGYDLKWRRCSP
jgi:Domain of unknown function (DUF4360)